MIDASSNNIALMGSPVFHVALALLIVVIGVGRLSRAEGSLGLPEGFARVDTSDSYVAEEAGPLYPGRSGHTLIATDIRPYTDAGGVYRGVTPVLELRDGDALLAKGRVYPNSPMRHGTMLIHSSDYGLAAAMSVEASTGTQAVRAQPVLDFDPQGSAVAGPSGFDVIGEDGSIMAQVSVEVPLDVIDGEVSRTRPADLRAQVIVSRPGSTEPYAESLLRPGEGVMLWSGDRVVLDDIVYYSRVSIADDWSVYPIYALFAVAGAGMSLSLLVPYRRVLVRLVGDGAGRRIHGLVVQPRGDAAFRDRVTTTLVTAAAGKEAEDA